VQHRQPRRPLRCRGFVSVALQEPPTSRQRGRCRRAAPRPGACAAIRDRVDRGVAPRFLPGGHGSGKVLEQLVGVYLGSLPTPSQVPIRSEPNLGALDWRNAEEIVVLRAKATTALSVSSRLDPHKQPICRDRGVTRFDRVRTSPFSDLAAPSEFHHDSRRCPVSICVSSGLTCCLTCSKGD